MTECMHIAVLSVVVQVTSADASLWAPQAYQSSLGVRHCIKALLSDVYFSFCRQQV